MSRMQTVKDQILDEFRSITPGNGYANDLAAAVVYGIKNPDRITRPIEVGIQIGDEDIAVEDDACTSFESETDVYVEAVIKVGTDDDANFALADSMLTDLKRCTALMFKKYLNCTGLWNVRTKKKIIASPDIFTGSTKPVAKVGVRFSIMIRNLTAEF